MTKPHPGRGTQHDEKDMKKQLLLLIAATVAGLVSAQTLSLSLGDLNLSNDTLYVIGNTDDVLLESHITVSNLSDKEVEVNARKTELIVIPNTENTFCWGACYPPFIFEPAESVKIAANASDQNSFIGDYAPDGYEGTSILKYTFYMASNPTDNVSLVVFYQVGAASIFDWTLEADHFMAYPNPTQGILNVDFPGAINQEVSVKLISITGQTVFEEQLQYGQTSTQIDLSRKSKGYYFLEIKDQFGHAARKKIIKTN